VGQILIYFAVSLYSCFFAWRRLRRPGMSTEVKKIFMRKQISYVIAYMLMWTAFTVNSVYKMYFLIKQGKLDAN